VEEHARKEHHKRNAEGSTALSTAPPPRGLAPGDRLSDRSLLEITKVYPMDAVFDSPRMCRRR